MTREEYEEQFKRDYGISDEEAREMGIRVVPCWCLGTVPGCSGWQVEPPRICPELPRGERAQEAAGHAC